MEQAIARLRRIGQKYGVVWHILKTAYSFHDDQELSGLEKSAKTLSAQVSLTVQLIGTLREVVLWDYVNTMKGQNVDRLGWIIILGIEGREEFDPHDPSTVKLGHVISLLAKMLMSVTEDSHPQFLACSERLITALRHMEEESSVAQVVELLRDLECVLTAQCYEDVRNRAENESEDEHLFSEQIRQDREERDAGHKKSAEFVDL
ncbi:hypothetical protein CC79DRAFT_5044 [Sarocladium strictum]